MFGNFRTKKFCDIYDDVDKFIDDYQDNGIPALIEESSATTLYYLLYARYGNSTIANFDENQFKYKLFSTVFQYGPTWEKNLSIQAGLRSLTADDITEGSKVINNHAYNPNTDPGTTAPEELTYINEQHATKYKKSKLDGYLFLTTLLEKDVTEEFLNKFKKLFLQVVEPYKPLYFVTDTVEDEEEGGEDEQ